MTFDFLKNKKAIIFELDDVLYPSKDYLLQVYYLFAQFMEYQEQRNPQEILEFMQATFHKEGPDDIFTKTVKHFKLPEKYHDNFVMLHGNARLPLKLLLFQNILELLNTCVSNDIKIYIVTDGNPIEQLNKIRQIEWNDLGKHLTVFFTEELKQTKGEVLSNLLTNMSLPIESVVFVGANKFDEEQVKVLKMLYIASDKIYK